MKRMWLKECGEEKNQTNEATLDLPAADVEVVVDVWVDVVVDLVVGIVVDVVVEVVVDPEDAPCVDDGEVVADSPTVAVEAIAPPVVEGVSDNPLVGETFVL